MLELVVRIKHYEQGWSQAHPQKDNFHEWKSKCDKTEEGSRAMGSKKVNKPVLVFEMEN